MDENTLVFLTTGFQPDFWLAGDVHDGVQAKDTPRRFPTGIRVAPISATREVDVASPAPTSPPSPASLPLPNPRLLEPPLDITASWARITVVLMSHVRQPRCLVCMGARRGRGGGEGEQRELFMRKGSGFGAPHESSKSSRGMCTVLCSRVYWCDCVVILRVCSTE